MTVDTLRDKFVYHLQEMYYVENRLVEVLEGLATDAANEDLADAFEVHRDETRQQVERLETTFKSLGEPPEERPSPAFDALLAERDRFHETAAGDADMHDVHDLGSALKVEHLEIAGYENLLALARKLDLDHDDKTRLQRNLDGERQTKKQLKTLAEDSAVRELFARLAG